ncbi:MAG: HAMP domain-containing histidine kinase [Cardiobacteriaceae bacterium]|nr:HAMP domain-containing histidine kinase [Cardiobacteriaceae bacterium]
MFYQRVKELIFGKEPEQVQQLFTLRDQLQVQEIVDQRAFKVRERMAVIFNFVRILSCLVIVLFSSFLAGNDKPLIWQQSFDTREQVVFVGFSYAFLLLLLNIWNFRNKKRTTERFYLTSALLDLICFLLIASCFRLGVQWQPILFLFMLTALMSVLVLNVRHCLIYVVCVFFATMSYFLGVARLQFSSYGEFVERFQQSISKLPSDWLAISIVILAAAAVLFLLGFLANTARDNDIRAKLNRNYYAKSKQLNEAIITEMPNGLIVLNEKAEVIAINQKIREIFKVTDMQMPKMLHQLDTSLVEYFRNWKEKKYQDHHQIKIANEEFTATFTPIYLTGYYPLAMISLENIEVSYRRVRETRLASLGRLSAGIAHEIRNPLGTIQAANEILGELEEDNPDIQKLCKKIAVNSERINAIIRDILAMFDNRAQTYQVLVLQDFLQETIENSKTDKYLEVVDISVNTEATDDYRVHFDPGHLSQIIHNLLLNSLKHSGQSLEELKISVVTRLSGNGRYIFLDIEDNGRGVDLENAEHIFEPFYSSRKGIGLGLYLVREMALANQATIAYVPKDNGENGARFRITMEVHND